MFTCPSTLPRFDALQSLLGIREGRRGEIYFFQIFPRCLFDRWANLSRDERFDLTIFFLFLFLLFERIFRWNFIFGKNFGIFLIVRSDFVDSKLVRGECFAETEIDRNISILL